MSSNQSERFAYILGALLHDIGKFVQRAKKNPRIKDHCKWGEEWFQENLAEKFTRIFDEKGKNIIRTAINTHHDHMTYISLADSISAGMERISIENEEKGDPFIDRLISIFSRVSISEKPKKIRYYPLLPLGKDNLEETFPIPEKKCFSNEYSELLNLIEKEIRKLNFAGLTPHKIIDQIYFLFWKYTWCIPSAAYSDEPDISLFDHLKTTAAITACLYDYHREHPDETVKIDSPAFHLIGGDISGIQSYIFDVLTQQGKVAKRLRARSLFVQLISEIAAHKIIHRFNLPLCNIISSAGGNFYILLPNVKNAHKIFEELQSEFDRWTYETYRGEIFLTTGGVEANGKELGEFNNLLEKLKPLLQARKYKPYQSFLKADKQWQKDKFLFEEVIQGDESACNGCHKYPIKNEKEKLCGHCTTDITIGAKLPKIKYIAFFKDCNHRFPVLNYSFELWDKPLKDNSAYLILALNNTRDFGIGFKYLANHIPTAEHVNCAEPEHQHELNSPAFFECIANESSGDALLSYIKADVDNMGLIFRYGFDPENPRGKYKISGIKPSISRFCSLSRMLETFFAGYLQMKLESDFKDLYIIYSGGDDFFIVGPWNRAIDLAKDTRKKFSRFTGDNPDFTFSAGIILTKPTEPISFCARIAEDKLKDSKLQEGKDRITLFNQSISWDELNKILIEANKVIEWLEKDPPIISRAFAYNLREYGEMAYISNIFNPSKGINTNYLKFIPLLTYDIARNLSRKEQQEALDWSQMFLPSKDKAFGADLLLYLRIIMEYVLTYTRG